MTKRDTRLLPLIITCICLMSAWIWNQSQPVLLENEVPQSTIDSGVVLIPDEEIPLSDTTAPLVDETAEATAETAKDLYEGLNETQIQYVEEVVKLINEERSEAGVSALVLDTNLRKAAQIRAAECVGTFSHTRPNGTSYKTAITEAGMESKYTGENVATGHTSPKQLVDRLMKSDGHRANILNENFTKIGVGLEKNVGNRYGGYSWAQLFVK